MEKNPYLEGSVEEFITDNMGLVYKLVNQFAPAIKAYHSFEYEDLVSIGVEAMLKAYSKFDRSKFDVQFSTYAYPYIKGQIMRFLSYSAPFVRYSRTIMSLYDDIVSLGLQDQTVDVIATKMGETEDNIKMAFEYNENRCAASFNSVLYDSGKGSPVVLGDTLQAKPLSVEEILFKEVASKLDDCQLKVYKLWREGLYHAEIADKLGISATSVSRRVSEILKVAEDYGKGLKQEKPKPSVPKMKVCKAKKEQKKQERKDRHKLAKKLVKDMSLSMAEILRIAKISRKTCIEYRKQYLSSLPREDIRKYIEDLCNATEMTSAGLSARFYMSKDEIEELINS